MTRTHVLFLFMGKHFVKDIFKPLAFCTGKYQVSRFGKVKSVYSLSKYGVYRPTGTIIKTTVNDKGYEKVRLQWWEGEKLVKKTMAVHRLVGMAWVPNPHNKPEINHKDLNKLNNDFRNLEWCTPKENTNHAQEKGARRAKKPVLQSFYKNPFKPIIDLNTGIFYTSDELAILLNTKRRYICRMLSEERGINKTQYKYA